jgi:hypothetical protein
MLGNMRNQLGAIEGFSGFPGHPRADAAVPCPGFAGHPANSMTADTSVRLGGSRRAPANAILLPADCLPPLALGACSASPAFDAISVAPRKPLRSIADWVSEISQACGRGPANILRLARLVSQARVSLRHGEWSAVWRAPGIGLCKKEADRLVKIGKALGEADETNCSHLPRSERTLWHLSHLGWSTLKRLIEQGRVHPGLTMDGAKALLREFRPELAQKPSQSTVKQWLARVAAFVDKKVETWSLEERTLAQAGLLRLAEQLVAGDAAHDTRSTGSNGCNAAGPEQRCSSLVDAAPHKLGTGKSPNFNGAPQSKEQL